MKNTKVHSSIPINPYECSDKDNQIIDISKDNTLLLAEDTSTNNEILQNDLIESTTSNITSTIK